MANDPTILWHDAYVWNQLHATVQGCHIIVTCHCWRVPHHCNEYRDCKESMDPLLILLPLRQRFSTTATSAWPQQTLGLYHVYKAGILYSDVLGMKSNAYLTPYIFLHFRVRPSSLYNTVDERGEYRDGLSHAQSIDTLNSSNEPTRLTNLSLYRTEAPLNNSFIDNRGRKNIWSDDCSRFPVGGLAMKPLSLESVGSFKSKLSKVSLNDRLPFITIVLLWMPVNVPIDIGLMYAGATISFIGLCGRVTNMQRFNSVMEMLIVTT